VNHQRIGGDGQDFIKKDEGEQIGRKGDSDRGGKTDGEAGKVTGLFMLLETAHITDGIDGGKDPQAGGDQRKKDTELVRFQRQGYAGRYLPEGEPGNPSGQGAGQEKKNEGKLHDACRERPEFPQGGMAGAEQDQRHRDQRNHHGIKR
jgi:hypothetical protein